MNYLLDTNILLLYLRGSNIAKYIDEKYSILSNNNKPVISVVTLGEIRSLGLQNNWGKKRHKLLTQLTNQFLISDINVETIISRYAEIDAYSQGKLRDKSLQGSFLNMGKNDLWIASTASVLNIPLITTDKDFLHLHNIYLKLEYIKIQDFK